MSKQEMVYPQRQRCKKCRRYFGAVVLLGQYCSYQCAGRVAPPDDVEKAPRECRRNANGKWDWKRKFLAVEHIPETLRNDPETNVYWCGHCLFLHVGHSRPRGNASMRRTVSDLETLGSVLQRYRESRGIDKKALAKHMGVPIIRITEIERGDWDLNAYVLMRLLQTLDVELTLSGR